jgi:soluble lytic murein transglycosylase-like protein
MGSNRIAVLSGLALLVGIGVAAPASGGELFRQLDKNGVLHVTQAPTRGGFERFELVGRLNRATPGPAQRSIAPGNAAPRAARRGGNGSYDALIQSVARSAGLPPGLVKAVIATESNFDAAAVSNKGALGLMQLMPGTAEMLGVEDPMHAEANVLGGVRYLKELLDRYGSVSYALAAYNAGPGMVDRYGGIPPFPETRQYVERVLAYYRHYHAQFAP